MDTHAEFLGALDESSPAVFAFARYMNDKGHSVAILKKKHAPTHQENRAYRDSGDMFTIDDNFRPLRRVEVKGRKSCFFTCADDYPYPDVYVTREDSGRAALADPRTWFWAVISADLKYAGIIPRKTHESWRVTDPLVPVGRKQPETYFACPKNLVEFRRIEFDGGRHA